MARKYNESKEGIQERSKMLKKLLYNADVSPAILATELQRCITTIYSYLQNPDKVNSGEADTIAELAHMSAREVLFVFYPSSYHRLVKTGEIRPVEKQKSLTIA